MNQHGERAAKRDDPVALFGVRQDHLGGSSVVAVSLSSFHAQD